jgi:hypothetical protein
VLRWHDEAGMSLSSGASRMAQAGLPPPAGRGQARDIALGSGLQLLTGAERMLWEASERALRQPRDKIALVLHLSRLAPPAPRPHHIRVANVLLQDAARRFGGQVFALRNRDLVLLCSVAGPHQGDQALAPENLPQTMARLFLADVPDASQLTSLWPLEQDGVKLQAYLAASSTVAREPDPVPGELPGNALSLAALQEILAHAPLAGLMIQHTAMALDAAREQPVLNRLKPAFREIGISLAGLNLRPLVAQAIGDPYLRRHFAAGLELRLIQLLHDDLAAQGRLTRPALAGGLPMHLDLGLEAVLSPGFARLTRLARDAGMHIGVAMPAMQICAELDLMQHARNVLRLTGCSLVLSGVDAFALSILRPDALEPDLIKLAWSPRLAEARAAQAGPGGLIARALAGLDPARLILHGVDSDQALAWGQAQRIAIFQGPFLDQVQAATRMARCHSAAACTLRQCTTRGTSLGLPGRAGCANPGLLEAGFSAA